MGERARVTIDGGAVQALGEVQNTGYYYCVINSCAASFSRLGRRSMGIVRGF